MAFSGNRCYWHFPWSFPGSAPEPPPPSCLPGFTQPKAILLFPGQAIREVLLTQGTQLPSIGDFIWRVSEPVSVRGEIQPQVARLIQELRAAGQSRNGPWGRHRCKAHVEKQARKAAEPRTRMDDNGIFRAGAEHLSTWILPSLHEHRDRQLSLPCSLTSLANAQQDRHKKLLCMAPKVTLVADKQLTDGERGRVEKARELLRLA
ncbi:uncharacterized protein LOC125092396 [Lutra lutra]|uniref:uncharacterized protein LOC125092396 n=1 Tax=Lutra lutra TaxID=9657 RepID=UPI001FCF9DAA|nr:uncharacterized protein LOC125092396 [Lutra lutra]